MRTINGASRGCGSLQAGGFYAQGTIGNGGQLQPWSWCFGTGMDGLHNLYLNPPDRRMVPINLPNSLGAGRIVEAHVERVKTGFPALNNLPAIALCDHVGSAHYTPFGFAEETVQRGPSRRVPYDIAKALAGHTPIPIVFTHDWIPVIPVEDFDVYWEWMCSQLDANITPVEMLEIAPSFTNDKWGIIAGAYTGERHWLRMMLEAMHNAADGKVKKLIDLPGMYLGEQVFGISWITDLVYIADGTEDDGKLNRLLLDGIEPVKVGND